MRVCIVKRLKQRAGQRDTNRSLLISVKSEQAHTTAVRSTPQLSVRMQVDKVLPRTEIELAMQLSSGIRGSNERRNC